MSNLKHIREQIDIIDQNILELLAVRFALAEQAMKYKDKITDPAREEMMKELWQEWSEELELSVTFSDSLREIIINEAKRLQKKL